MKIKSVDWIGIQGTNTTLCVLVTETDFVVVGQSNAADGKKFDDAYDNALKKLAEHDAYLGKYKAHAIQQVNEIFAKFQAKSDRGDFPVH